MADVVSIHWQDAPEDKDFPSATSFLGLLWPEAQVLGLVQKLQAAPLTRFKAKDIFRASGLPLLGVSNLHLAKDRKKIQDGKPLSPILLVRDPDHSKVVVADGYHRLCAVYSFSEDEWIPCKIV